MDEGEDTDRLGGYSYLSLTLRDESGPLLRQTFRAYYTGVAEWAVIVETTAVRDMSGTSVADSYFHATFNSPVFRLAAGFSYLTFTWGLTGREGTGISGHFPTPPLHRVSKTFPSNSGKPTSPLTRTYT